MIWPIIRVTRKIASRQRTTLFLCFLSRQTPRFPPPAPLQTPDKSACTRIPGTETQASPQTPLRESPPPPLAPSLALLRAVSRPWSSPAADYSANNETPAAPDSAPESLSLQSHKYLIANPF